MTPCTLRVVNRFCRKADAEESDPAKGGVPARWQEWMKVVHQGGQQKVPNPNPETRSRFHEVSFSTALKDKNVFKKAIKDYHEWVKKNPENGGGKSAPEKPDEKKPAKDSAPASRGSLNLKGPLKVSDEDLDKIIAKHKDAFNEIVLQMKDEVSGYSKKYPDTETLTMGTTPTEEDVKEFESLSVEEKMIHVAGHRIGEVFQQQLSKDSAEAHKIFTKAWGDSSSNPTSSQVHGALNSLGVEGYQTTKDKEHAAYREAGAKKEWLKDTMKEAYAFQQAFFKHIGLKELSLYRGVMGYAYENASDGDEVSMKTRELSSFTSDPAVAAAFGRPLKVKVPVENILWSSLNTPRFGTRMPPSDHGESEIAVMGASSLSGKVLSKSRGSIPLEGR